MDIKAPEFEEKASPWIKFSKILQETLKLETSPVGISITSTLQKGIKLKYFSTTVCAMIQIARRGNIFSASKKSIFCGARSHLGIGKPLIPNMDRFLVRHERLFRSREAAGHLLSANNDLAPTLGNYLTFSPLEKSLFAPDVAVIIANPSQVSRIIFLDAFETGEFDLVHREPLCTGAIAVPITTGKIGISFLDIACRGIGRYQPEEMAVGIPYSRLSRIVENIELSSAGRAKPSYFVRAAVLLSR